MSLLVRTGLSVARTLVLMGALLAVGCGIMEEPGPNGNGNDNDDQTPGSEAVAPSADQIEALKRLGVDTSQTPRIDGGGTELPDTYNPLGTKSTIGVRMELYAAGMEVTPESAPHDDVATLFQDLSCRADDSCQPADVVGMALSSLDETSAPWMREAALSHQAFSKTLRATAAADVDGDGFDEIVSVYAKGADEIRVNITDDESDGFAVEDFLVGRLASVYNVSMAAGDFDGDGAFELAVGLCVPGKAYLWHLGDSTESFVLDASQTDSFNAIVAGGTISLEMAAGQLDYDAAHELVLVMNEVKDFCNPVADSRYFVFDDATKNYVGLDDGPVQDRTKDGSLRTSVATSVALGDIDADGLDEIIFAGLTGFPGCSNNDCTPPPAVLIAWDDAVNSFKSLGASLDDFSPHACLIKVRYLHVNTLDIDGDNIAEVQVNQFIYDDWKNEASWTKLPYGLPYDSLYGEWNDPNTYNYGKHTSAITTGDFTGDDLEDIAFTAIENGDSKLLVYASNVHAPTPGLKRIYAKSIAFGSSPMLTAVNVDIDGAIVEFEKGSHSLEYTQPIVLAVLAAPPCIGDGQNSDACTTSFGNSSTIGSEKELGFTVSAGVTVGVSIEDRTFTQSAIDISATLKKKLGLTTGHAYKLTKSVVRTTGPMEDGVIFLTQPMDRYVYKIVSHVEPELIGTLIDVWLPRESMIIMAEREFYNASVTEGSLKIDKSILAHTVGDPMSYPTWAQKDQILASANPLMQNGPQAVGQGNGQTELSIDVENEFSAGASLALEFEFEAETTIGGVKIGASFGFEAESSFALTAGSATRYAGTIGNLDAEHFADNQYKFGLFTYRHTDATTGQQFEVINYWVE